MALGGAKRELCLHNGTDSKILVAGAVNSMTKLLRSTIQVSHARIGVEQVFHELHRVVALLFRLFEEEVREQRQMVALKMCRDAHILHAGTELMSDLGVERLGER